MPSSFFTSLLQDSQVSQLAIRIAVFVAYYQRDDSFLPRVWLSPQDQLHLLRAEQRGLNPMDPTAVASLAESERALMTRIAEKKVQMMVSHSLV